MRENIPLLLTAGGIFVAGLLKADRLIMREIVCFSVRSYDLQQNMIRSVRHITAVN